MPLRTILVGLDGSSYSEAAGNLALNWAQRFNALIAAMGVIDEPNIRSPQDEPVGGAKIEEQLESKHVKQARNEVRDFLEDFGERCRQRGVHCELISRSGRPFEQILLESERYDVTLLGKESHVHYEEQRNPSSTLNRVLKSAPHPVVAVPESPRGDNGILVAYDGSISAARALQFLVGNGLHSLGDTYILSVDSDSQEKANAIASRARDFLDFHQVSCHMLPVVSDDDVGEIIVDEADRLSVEVIMMGAFGRAALAEMIFGSVTEHVVDNTPAPVFLAN